jgi:hypothetical protein
MAATVRVGELLDGHVGLDIESLDRVYLNGYVPTLQVGGQVVGFMTRHLGYEIPSPAIMERIGTSFRRAVDSFAAANRVPLVRFAKTDRKQEVMRPYLARQARPVVPGWRRSAWLRRTRTSSPARNARTAATPDGRCGSPSTRPTGG